jgi:tellurite resistance protein
MAAITIASLHMYEVTQKLAYQYIEGALLTLLTVVVAFLLYRTASAVKNHKTCIEGY